MDNSDSTDNLFSLPKEVKKFAKLQESLDCNIEKNEKLLENVEKKVFWAQRDVDNYFHEIANINRKISSIEDDVSAAEQRNVSLKNDIENTIKDIQDAKRQITDIGFTKDTEARKFKITRDKMDKYKSKVEEMDGRQCLLLELKECRNRIAHLKKQKFEYENCKQLKHKTTVEEKIRSLRKDVDKLIVQKEYLQKLIFNKEKQLEETKIKSQQLRNEISVLHKRNSAQLLRLKRILEEMQTKKQEK